MRKEGLLYPVCLSVLLGWGVFFASYEYLAGDAERVIQRCTKILVAAPTLPARLVGSKDKDPLLDAQLLEHRRMVTLRAQAEAVGTARVAAMASAAIAAAVGVFVFGLAKPRRAKKKRRPAH